MSPRLREDRLVVWPARSRSPLSGSWAWPFLVPPASEARAAIDDSEATVGTVETSRW